MSGKLDKQSDVQSPRSQFSALTMKIFDKLQGGRPRRPASLRKSPRTSDENVPQPWQSHMCQGAQRLLEAEREAVASLKYLRQVAGKGVAELLPMSASRLLECMLALQQALLHSNDRCANEQHYPYFLGHCHKPVLYIFIFIFLSKCVDCLDCLAWFYKCLLEFLSVSKCCISIVQVKEFCRFIYFRDYLSHSLHRYLNCYGFASG
uniref:Uncharacterized protein n=2 Tax=Eptatretus burgeri TaxID=7764 RepID=A0A8C4NG80_EPTBU